MNTKISVAGRRRGSAVLVVLVLLGCIALLLYANSKTLYALEQELNLLEAKHQAKYEQGSGH